MNPEILRIENYLSKSEYFKKIKDIKAFAEKIYNAYRMNTDIVRELQKMEAWLYANPNRLKKNYARFIVNWLNRCDAKNVVIIKK